MRKHLSVLAFVALAAFSVPVAAQTAQPPATVPAPVQLASAKPAAAPAPTTILLEQILVKVNGDILTKTELESRQIEELRRRGVQAQTDEQLRKAIVELTPEVLMNAVDEMLMLQRGKELGYKVTEEQYKRVLENIRKENKLESDEAFAAALKQEGLDMSVLRKNLERQLVINQVQNSEVFGKLGITEGEAQKYYAVHQPDFTTPASITLREIMFSVPTDGKTVNVASDEATKKKAEAVLARIKAGESFEKLVGEGSDSPSKANGGLVGPLSADELAPDIKKLIDPLKPGQTTDVFRTPRGYGILKLETSSTAVVKDFASVRDQIADRIYNEKRRAEYDRYIRKLRAEGIIEWKNEEMQKLWIARTLAPVITEGK